MGQGWACSRRRAVAFSFFRRAFFVRSGSEDGCHLRKRGTALFRAGKKDGAAGQHANKTCPRILFARYVLRWGRAGKSWLCSERRVGVFAFALGPGMDAPFRREGWRAS